jgi:hypothetical protein
MIQSRKSHRNAITEKKAKSIRSRQAYASACGHFMVAVTVVVTEGKTSEIKVARTLRFAPGTILAIDRGYNDYEWFRELTQEEVYFVTRIKDKAVYEVQEEQRPEPAQGMHLNWGELEFDGTDPAWDMREGAEVIAHHGRTETGSCQNKRSARRAD